MQIDIFPAYANQKVGAMIMAIAVYSDAPKGVQQLFLSFSHMPVEDATTEWSETDSSFIKVATIRIPIQTFDTKTQNKYDR